MLPESTSACTVASNSARDANGSGGPAIGQRTHSCGPVGGVARCRRRPRTGSWRTAPAAGVSQCRARFSTPMAASGSSEADMDVAAEDDQFMRQRLVVLRHLPIPGLVRDRAAPPLRENGCVPAAAIQSPVPRGGLDDGLARTPSTAPARPPASRHTGVAISIWDWWNSVVTCSPSACSASGRIAASRGRSCRVTGSMI